MRPILRASHAWAAGSLLALIVGGTTNALAVPIDGRLDWSGAADVRGELIAGREPAGLVLGLLPGGPTAAPAWTMRAEGLTLTRYYWEQPEPSPPGLPPLAGPGSPWEEQTLTFVGAYLDFTLRSFDGRPVQSLLASDAPGAAVFAAEPSLGGAVEVRTTSVGEGPFRMARGDWPAGRVPGHEAGPTGRLLEVSHFAAWTAEGSLQAALFGGTLAVSTAGATLRYETGPSLVGDGTTEAQRYRVEYIVLSARDGRASGHPSDEAAVLYTPLLQYEGLGLFPDGAYAGAFEERVLDEDGRIRVPGSVWLAADASDGARSRVRAWGDAHWSEAVVPRPDEGSSLLWWAAGVAGILGVAGWLSTVAARMWGAGTAAGLYARRRDGPRAENPTRARIYELVRTQPGMNLTQIVRQLDIGWGTAAYHTQILKRQNMVRDLRFLNRVCFFPAVDTPPDVQIRTILLRQPNYLAIVQILRERDGLSQREIALQAGHARQYVSRLLAKMQDAGLIASRPSPNGRRYYLQSHPAPVVPDATRLGGGNGSAALGPLNVAGPSAAPSST